MGRWKAAKRVLHYLTGTVHMGSVYSCNPPDLFTTFSATPITAAVQFVVDNIRCRKAFVDEESSATTLGNVNRGRCVLSVSASDEW